MTLFHHNQHKQLPSTFACSAIYFKETRKVICYRAIIPVFQGLYHLLAMILHKDLHLKKIITYKTHKNYYRVIEYVALAAKNKISRVFFYSQGFANRVGQIRINKQDIDKGSHQFKALVRDHIRTTLWDVIIHTCPHNFSRSLANIRYGYVMISHKKCGCTHLSML